MKGNITAFPKNKSARKRLQDSTPLTSISSESGSIPHSISEPLTKQNLTEYIQNHNPSTGLNSEYIIRNNANKTGNNFYQIKEVGSGPAYSQHNRALEPEPKYSVNNYEINNNPQPG